MSLELTSELHLGEPLLRIHYQQREEPSATTPSTESPLAGLVLQLVRIEAKLDILLTPRPTFWQRLKRRLHL